tara:strand:+ start:1090 stop:2166 length:1077 start_codon:yes stop_codon:yes gene_type:complete
MFKIIIRGSVLNSIIICKTLSIQGILTLSSLTSNDIPKRWSNYELGASYIPTLSIKKELSNTNFLDFESAYYLKRDYTGDSLYNNLNKIHRLWLRYATKKLETRLGLQKIIFGPTQILRPLSWFDTFDLKDPTGQTNGVEAFRLKWFPSNDMSLWMWLIQNTTDTVSYGLRTELASSIGEFGITYHLEPTNTKQNIGSIDFPINSPHSRFALDYRFDGFIGFWNESVIIKSEKSQILLSSLGFDYTIPVSNGIIIMAEAMYSSNNYENLNINENYYSVIMASMPIGIMHMVTYISQFEFSEEKNYHYFRWSSTFDSYSLNIIFSLNPKRNQYKIPTNLLPKTLLGFGTGIQFMFIYNH